MSALFRVAIVDDHPLVRAGIAYTLGMAADFEVVASGGCSDDAIQIAGAYAPDIMLLDINMPGSGLEAARAISESHKAIKVMFLTVSERQEDVITALEVGARGYLLKGISGPDLMRSLRSVSAGETYITPEFAARVLATQQQKPKLVSPSLDLKSQLSIREFQVLREVARGSTNKEIGLKLQLTEKTIKHYMSNVLVKLGARNRMEAVFATKGIFNSSSPDASASAKD
jgi:DNA-binding NarL/FixJ family response regulator